jgi:hypothetical protein
MSRRRPQVTVEVDADEEDTMGAGMRRSVAVVAAAAVAALAGWAVIRLLGVTLTVRVGGGPDEVGAADVLVAAVLAGLAAWAVHAALARRLRAGWWPFVGSTAIAVSVVGPSWLADGAAAVALICLHLLVGVVLITGFARSVSRPS